MSEPALLTVEKLEVVYHRAITAVQGISLSVRRGPDRRHPGERMAPANPQPCARSRVFLASTMPA